MTLQLATQADVARLVLSDVDVMHVSGPYGSGKTRTALKSGLLRFLRDHPTGEGALLARSRDSMQATIGEVVMPTAAEIGVVAAPENHGIRVGDAFLWRVIGADRTSHERLKGRNLGFVFADETTDLPESLIDQSLDRLRVAPECWIGCTNPASPAHSLYTRLVEPAGREGRHLTLPLWENPVLPLSYVNRQRSRYRGAAYQRFVVGEWVTATGAVFPWLADAFAATPEGLPSRCGIGVDFGSSVSTHAVLFEHHGTSVHAVGEWVHNPEFSGPMRARDQAAAIVDWVSDNARAPLGTCIVDLAEQAFEDSLDYAFSKAGRSVEWLRYRKLPIQTGQRIMDRQMQNGRFRIDHGRCPVMVSEMAALEHAEGRLERGDEAQDPEMDDHGADACRYYMVHVVEGA